MLATVMPNLLAMSGSPGCPVRLRLDRTPLSLACSTLVQGISAPQPASCMCTQAQYTAQHSCCVAAHWPGGGVARQPSSLLLWMQLLACLFTK